MNLRLGLLLAAFLGSGIYPAPAADGSSRLAPYLYEDTRRLVKLVEDAAEIVEEQGESAFSEFGRKGSRWFNENCYFFVYDTNGVCLFHPVEPTLVGKPLMELKDMNGKPVIRMITDIAKQPEPDAAGWVFYLWEERTQFMPGWKSSYIRKAVSPDGVTFLVGSGAYNIKIEPVFVRDHVNMAVEALKREGRETAFARFRDLSQPFYFLDTYIFVLDLNGRALVDPAYPTQAGRDLMRLQDAVGRYVVREIIEKMRASDESHTQYMWPKPGSSLPSRKVAYTRKVEVDGEVLIVGCDYFLATPIWMK